MSGRIFLKVWMGMTIYVLAFVMPIYADVATASKQSIGFVLQLGLDKRTIQVTPEFKEGALQASLPLFSAFAQKLQLPLPNPLTPGDVIGCQITPFENSEGVIDHVSIETKEGYSFSYFGGIVRGFSSPRAYSAMKGVQGVSNYFGTIKISEKQAIKSARDTILNLGVPLEDVFAEQQPKVLLPTSWTNTIARYIIEWRDPRGGDNSPTVAKVEINAETGHPEYIWLLPIKSLQGNFLKVAVFPPKSQGRFDSMIPPPVNPDYAWKLIPMMLQAIDQYATRLSLPIPPQLTTNNVARIEIHDNGGWPDAQVDLTNGWRFVYRHAMVNGYFAPDNFFDSDNRKIRIRDFAGKWNLTTNQAIEVVRRAMAKLDYSTNNVHMDFQPNVYAASVAKDRIPRLRFEWFYSVKDSLQSRLEAEVNTDSGTLESLYYDDKAYWNARPPINVPISTDNQK